MAGIDAPQPGTVHFFSPRGAGSVAGIDAPQLGTAHAASLLFLSPAGAGSVADIDAPQPCTLHGMLGRLLLVDPFPKN